MCTFLRNKFTIKTFQLQTKSSIHTNAFSSKKVFSSWEKQGGLFHWRKHYYELWTSVLARSNGLNEWMNEWCIYIGLKLRYLNDGFVAYNQAAFSFIIDGLELCWLCQINIDELQFNHNYETSLRTKSFFIVVCGCLNIFTYSIITEKLLI